MGEVKVTVPRLRLIAGRYFWRPTPAVKALGFSAEPLGSDPAKAIDRAKALNADVEKALAGEPTKQILPGTVADVIRIYREDDAYTKLAPATKRGYEVILRAIEGEDVANSQAATVTRKGLKAIYREIKKRGTHIGAAHMRVWSILMKIAMDEGLRQDNPAAKMNLQTPPSRDQRWMPDEVATFCGAARKAGRASLALAVLLAYRLYQREGDVLRLSRSAIKGGIVYIRQNKTDARVGVAVDAELRAALEMAPKEESTCLVISEATGLPYKADYFRHEFARVRELAKLPAKLRFSDLRRSALTEAGEGGATVSELQAVSGHKTLSQLATYVRPTTEMARSAVRKRSKVARKK